METPDDLTLKVTLKGPTASVWRDGALLEAASNLGVPSPAALAKYGDDGLAQHPVGAGPLEFVSYTPGQKTVLKRSDRYWNKDAYPFAGLEVLQVGAGAARLTALSSGLVDIAEIGATDAQTAKAQKFNVFSFPGDRSVPANIMFCATRAPLNNIKVRQAITYAIDRQQIVDIAYNGQAQANATYLPKSHKWYAQDIGDSVATNLTKAKQLMTESGVSTPMKLTLRIPGDPAFSAVGETIQQQLTKIGVQVELIPSSNVHVDQTGGSADMWINAAVPWYTWEGIYRPGNPVDYCKQTEFNPLYQAGLTRASVVLSAADAKTADHKFQELQRDAAPAVFLLTPLLTVAYTDHIRGIDYIWARNGGTDGPAFATVFRTK
jgi:ABC-type transport system substrate-binding protein